MNQDIKPDWVAALRSGKYKQGREYLRWGDEFCCLGVLCDLHRQAVGGLDWKKGFFEDGPPGYYKYGEGSSLLPPEVAEWAQLEHYSLIEGEGGFSSTLSGMNDTGMTFTEIADLIESQL